MKQLLLPALATALLLLSPNARAAVILGPTTYTFASPPTAIVDVTTVTTAQLSGEDQLIISYSVTRGNTTVGDSWVTATFNTADTNKFTFTTSGVFAALLRTNTDTTNTHAAFNATTGSWSPNNTAVDFDAATPSEHAVRITVGGLSSSGFTGVKNITYEIDHYASTFGSADRIYTGTIDFGATDVGLNIDLRSNLAGNLDPAHSVNNFTITAIPEPSTALLSGLFCLTALARRRRAA